MAGNLGTILKEALLESKPDTSEIEKINKDLKEFISMAEKCIKSAEFERIHGSRDYFKIEIEPW
ncbi:MAG: hypothetical protein M1165_00975, partial [Candidatus Pacearchaeota archaeon]|nr:hypothetical protein [Candidatus Pacearchaeota archaeon]